MSNASDFRDWWKDDRGAEFWKEIEEKILNEGETARGQILAGELHQAVVATAKCEGLIEAFELPQRIIEQIQEEEEQKKGEKK